MPSEFAKSLSTQLREFFSLVTDTTDDDLANTIDFHVKFLDEQMKDDLEPLLFIEFGKELPAGPLTMEHAKRIVARVQQRIYRETRRASHLPYESVDPIAPAESIRAERAVAQFISQVRDDCTADDAIIFQLRYVDGESVASICEEMKLKKSTVYERIRILKDKFKHFLDDLPGS